jgi:hypothetical protein
MLRAWQMLKAVGPFCDRIFLQKALHERFGITLVNAKTVVFRTQYVLHYKAAKRQPPPNAKGPRLNFRSASTPERSRDTVGACRQVYPKFPEPAPQRRT